MDFLDHWLPFELKFEGGKWRMLWLAVGNHHFNEPFFDETVGLLKIKKGGSRFLSCTSLETFMELPIPRNVIPLSGLIFHVSRCGSTLLSQALSVAKENIVVPEAPLFDQILRMNEIDERISKYFINQLLLKVIQWYGQDRTGKYRQYFVKLDSWHIHFYKQLRDIFPNVSFYFLIREPSAIIKSHVKKRGIHTIPGYIDSKLLGVDLKEEHFRDFNAYTENVLANFYIANAEILNEKSNLNYFFDYSLGVNNMLADFYKKVLRETEVPTAVNARLSKYSKEPGLAFAGDTIVDYQIKNVALIAVYEQLLERMIKY